MVLQPSKKGEFFSRKVSRQTNFRETLFFLKPTQYASRVCFFQDPNEDWVG